MPATLNDLDAVRCWRVQSVSMEERLLMADKTYISFQQQVRIFWRELIVSEINGTTCVQDQDAIGRAGDFFFSQKQIHDLFG